MTTATDMIRVIEYHMRDTQAETGRARLAPAVLAAMARVPRDRFMPAASRRMAYDDTPLPIGHGQTISQPFIVALMTDLLDPAPGHRILEVGTGSGYQAAILAEVVDQVYGIEIVASLAERATRLLKELGYSNVHISAGDGRRGWPEQAPFDGITVAAAGHRVPEALLQQLRVGGHMVLPVESALGWQNLQVVTRTDETHFKTRNVLGVRFVPLIGEENGD